MISLAELRKQCGKSQAQVAAMVGTTQSGVSRIERQEDHRLSTLLDYVDSLDCKLRLVVEHDGGLSELSLGLRPEGGEGIVREFRVIWQDRGSRDLIHVGWLTHGPSGFRFSYTDEARSQPAFRPFPKLPDLAQTYESTNLFPFFSMRLPSSADPDFSAALDAIGLSESAASPLELLTRSPGDSPHDTVQIIPEPLEGSDGTMQRVFPVSGVRHANEHNPAQLAMLVESLNEGERLELRPEPYNQSNPRALQLFAREMPVGWIPNHLLDEIHAYRKTGRKPSFAVDRANGPGAPWHLRLLCKVTLPPIKTST